MFFYYIPILDSKAEMELKSRKWNSSRRRGYVALKATFKEVGCNCHTHKKKKNLLLVRINLAMKTT